MAGHHARCLQLISWHASHSAVAPCGRPRHQHCMLKRSRLKNSLRGAFLGQSTHERCGRAISTTFSDQRVAIFASPPGVSHSVQCPLSFLSAVARRIREDMTTPCLLLPISAGPFWAPIMHHVDTGSQPPEADSQICVRVRHALCKSTPLCVCRGRAAGLLSNVLLNTWHMLGRNSQRELRKQLSEKCASTVQNLVKAAGTVREQSGSEVRLTGFVIWLYMSASCTAAKAIQQTSCTSRL
jgi:hypothetical protein